MLAALKPEILTRLKKRLDEEVREHQARRAKDAEEERRKKQKKEDSREQSDSKTSKSVQDANQKEAGKEESVSLLS